MCLVFEYQVYVSNTFCFQNRVSIFASNNVASLVSLSISLSNTPLNPHNHSFVGMFSNNCCGLNYINMDIEMEFNDASLHQDVFLPVLDPGLIMMNNHIV